MKTEYASICTEVNNIISVYKVDNFWWKASISTDIAEWETEFKYTSAIEALAALGTTVELKELACMVETNCYCDTDELNVHQHLDCYFE